MEKVEVGNTKEYLEYCKRMHKKDRFMRIHKNMFHDPETKHGDCGWMNCGILFYGCFKKIPGTEYPTAIEAKIGHGKATNSYRITMHKNSHGVSIVKTLSDNGDFIKYKYFVCGNEPEPIFGDFKTEHETIETEEIVYLCNKNWLDFKGVNTRNKYNIQFLEEFKKLFVERLLYCEIVYYLEEYRKYVDFEYRKIYT